ncbi:MAG: hypothetical protein ACO3ZW_09895 [Opitutales bacterium]
MAGNNGFSTIDGADNLVILNGVRIQRPGPGQRELVARDAVAPDAGLFDVT